ncbi:MAG: hypothetical protein ACRCWR_00240 [Saezia sp.]
MDYYQQYQLFDRVEKRLKSQLAGKKVRFSFLNRGDPAQILRQLILDGEIDILDVPTNILSYGRSLFHAAFRRARGLQDEKEYSKIEMALLATIEATEDPRQKASLEKLHRERYVEPGWDFFRI